MNEHGDRAGTRHRLCDLLCDNARFPYAEHENFPGAFKQEFHRRFDAFCIKPTGRVFDRRSFEPQHFYDFFKIGGHYFL